ncbi:MAG: hypothetical protein ABFD77_02760 [Thermotogota bacterium]
MPITEITLGHFSGGRNLSEKGDTDPNEKQLDDLILELQQACNANEAAAGAHAARHITGGGDTIASAVAGGAAGLMTGADKTKLNGVATGATNTPLGSANPADLGAAAPGTATNASREDHVHAHGDQAGGTLHADVVAGGADGFMTGADKTKLDGIAAGAGNYTPAAGADWADPDPTTVTAALDRISSALAAHLGIPIP